MTSSASKLVSVLMDFRDRFNSNQRAKKLHGKLQFISKVVEIVLADGRRAGRIVGVG